MKVITKEFLRKDTQRERGEEITRRTRTQNPRKKKRLGVKVMAKKIMLKER